MALKDIPEEFNSLTGLRDGEDIYIFSAAYDHEREGIPFIYNQNNELAFELNLEDALNAKEDIKKQTGIEVVVWKLVAHRVNG